MCSVFERFEAPPPAGWVTTLERDCQFFACEGAGLGEGEGEDSYCPHYPSHDTTALTSTRHQVGREIQSGAAMVAIIYCLLFWCSVWMIESVCCLLSRGHSVGEK